jgi:hypothetical protein
VARASLMALKSEVKLGRAAAFCKASRLIAHGLFDFIGLMPDYGYDGLRREAKGGSEYVSYQRTAREMVKDFRALRFHAGSQPRCHYQYVSHNSI